MYCKHNSFRFNHCYLFHSMFRYFNRNELCVAHKLSSIMMKNLKMDLHCPFHALKTYPAFLGAEIWDRISECVPDRSKKDCMKKYKELAELI